MNDLRLLSRPSRQRLGSSHHATDRSPRFLELPQQPATNVAGRSCDQDASDLVVHRLRYWVVADSQHLFVCLPLEIVRLDGMRDQS